MSLNPANELFCQFYVKNDALFANATLAYAEAYDFNLDELSRDDAQYDDEKKLIQESSYNRAYNTCAVNGSKLLKKANIQERVTTLLNEILTNEVVDGEMAKVMKQNYKLDSKVAAIKEYNKLRNRITDNVKVTHTISDVLDELDGQTPTGQGVED